MFVVGLTGGIGSGKTTVSRVFSRLGSTIIDTDEIAHELTADQGAAISSIFNAFGSEVVNSSGALDRTRLRQIVFSSLPAKQLLESILHPLIGEVVFARLASAREKNDLKLVVLVVPLLVETGRWLGMVNRVLVIDASVEAQLRRVRARPGMTDQLARSVMQAQANRNARLRYADDSIFNDDEDEARVERAVSDLFLTYSQLARSV